MGQHSSRSVLAGGVACSAQQGHARFPLAA